MQAIYTTPQVNYKTADDIIKVFASIENIKPGTQISVTMPDDASHPEGSGKRPYYPPKLTIDQRGELKRFILSHSTAFGGNMTAVRIGKIYGLSDRTINYYVGMLRKNASAS